MSPGYSLKGLQCWSRTLWVFFFFVTRGVCYFKYSCTFILRLVNIALSILLDCYSYECYSSHSQKFQCHICCLPPFPIHRTLFSVWTSNSAGCVHETQSSHSQSAGSIAKAILLASIVMFILKNVQPYLNWNTSL